MPCGQVCAPCCFIGVPRHIRSCPSLPSEESLPLALLRELPGLIFS